MKLRLKLMLAPAVTSAMLVATLGASVWLLNWYQDKSEQAPQNKADDDNLHSARPSIKPQKANTLHRSSRSDDPPNHTIGRDSFPARRCTLRERARMPQCGFARIG